MSKSEVLKETPKARLANGTMLTSIVALVHWFTGSNESRQETSLLTPAKSRKDGTTAETGVFESLLTDGWLYEFPIQAIQLPYEHDKRYTADVAVAEREALLKKWQVHEETQAKYRVMKDIWFPNGKAVKPVFMGNTGNRRGLSLPDVLTAKVQQAALKAERYNPAEFTIPLVVRQFASELERVIEQGFENESRVMKGVENLNWSDRLKMGRYILRKGGNEASLRKAMKDGNGQKAYAILMADGQYPDLHILDRVNMPVPEKFRATPESYEKGGYLPASRIRNADLRKAIAKGADAVETYFRTEVFGSSTAAASKVTGKDVWESLPAQGCETGSPLDLIRTLHLSGQGFEQVFRQYPEIAKAAYVGSVASDGKRAATSKGKVHAKA